MPRIVLATPPSLAKRRALNYPPIYPPLGILYVAASIRKKSPGWEISVLDGQKMGEARFFSSLERLSPDAVGLSFHSAQSPDAFLAASRIRRELPGAFLVAGGPHPTFFPAETVSKGFDAAVVGEAEVTFPALLSRVAAGKSLKGVAGAVWKSGGRIVANRPRPFVRDLDSLPFPARDLVDIKAYPGYYYSRRKPDTSIMSSRGCPFNCSFCSKTWDVGRPAYRARSAASVADELELLAKEYGMREIYDWADEFNLVPKKAVEMLREISKRKLDLSLKAQFRADLITDELAREMKAAGFWLAMVGMESANPATLLGTGKGITVGQIIRACEKLKANGIGVLGFFMGFNVWEDGRGRLRWEGVAETRNTLGFIRLLRRRRLLDYFTFSVATPYPGSRLYDICRRHGLMPANLADFTSHEPVLGLPGVEGGQVRRVMREAALLQAETALASGGLNRSVLGFYGKKAAEMLGL